MAKRRAWEQDLLRFHVDELAAAAGRPIPFDEVVNEYRRQLLSVLAFWTVTVNPSPDMPDMHPLDSSLEFVHRVATAIDDLDAMHSFEY